MYVAGWGRSGSTIIDNLLGQVPGFFSVGEARYIWDRGLIENRLCGCGLPFRECHFWQSVFKGAYGGLDRIDPYEMVKFRQLSDLPRFNTFLMMGRSGKKYLARRSGPYVEKLKQLYESIHQVTGCKVIVDSSKTPCHASLVGQIESIDLYILHLIRDPRAVAFSWTRRKQSLDSDKLFNQITLKRSVAMWWAENVGAQQLESDEHYYRMRYEDFVSKPEVELLNAIHMIERDCEVLPFVRGTNVSLKQNHTISGNPVRFSRGDVALRIDDEWRLKMRPSQKAFITGLTIPLLLQYHYPLLS